MTVLFKLPELGEHVETADLIKIMVSVGDRIAVDQPVLELETDKADFELPSSVAGVVKDIHVQVGEKVRVGQLILTLEEESQPARQMPPEVRERPAPEKTTAREASGEGPAVAVPGTKPIPFAVPPG